MIQKLEKRRYRPSRELTYTAEGLPFCPRHGAPMSKREKQGDSWYSHKLTDPETGQLVYCRGYASASSPGFAILATSETAVVSPLPAANEVVSNGRTGSAPPKAVEEDLAAFNDMLFG